ncbi:MAG: hypothetical protein CBD33_03230 [Euryarchaeota archaeon TMED173]|nr:MAG: hypothetical protein CBD33_03230 [Euryarchaeota archaeon TMED173]|tara:strand:- start:836 stop:1504 length:669 start_codon:yes stop_codon:yes gene_type:complete
MDFQDLVDSPQKVKTLAGTVVFLVAFPIYFEALPSLIEDEISSGGSSGQTGSLQVIFEESENTLSESVVLSDGETYDSFFDVVLEDQLNIGFVEIQVSCNDNDDPGPGFTDSAEGQSDLSGVEGVEDKIAEGDCSGGGGGGFSMRWDITENYTGSEYTEEEMSESEILEMWDDGGKGRGSWIVEVTASIDTAPIAGGLIDNDEEYDITWTAVLFTVSITDQT